MYDERKEKFSFKSFFLTFLFILLFIFLMLWLFPTKNYVDQKLQSTYDLERLSIMYDEIFANNISRMKDAAIGYFTTERMPQTVGETKKLTLQEMYNLHLVLKMKDIDGNPCNTEKSYVEVTKYDEEYKLKVNLSCGVQEDYIIVYLGCYNYCDNGICEKRVPVSTEVSKDNNSNQQSKKRLYEYKLVVSDKTECSGWSSWQKNVIKETSTVKVDTKQEREIVGYSNVTTPVTKTQIVTKTVNEKYVVGNVSKLVLTGTKQVQVGTTTKKTTKEVQVGTVKVATGQIGSGTTVPKDTSTTIYKVISEDTNQSCSYCTNKTIYTWEVYKVQPVYDVKEVTETVPVYKTINVYETQEVPIYDYRTVKVQEPQTTTTYVNERVPQYRTVTYYRSKTCSVNKGYTKTEWSSSNADSTLLNKGYKLTGNVKEA